MSSVQSQIRTDRRSFLKRLGGVVAPGLGASVLTVSPAFAADEAAASFQCCRNGTCSDGRIRYCCSGPDPCDGCFCSSTDRGRCFTTIC